MTPDVLFSFVIELKGGNSSICAWPPRSCNSRVLSSETKFHVTESRYGLPACQYNGLRFSVTDWPTTRLSHMNGPVPIGCL